MRKVILQEFMTLDGFAAGPNNNVDFIPASTAGDQKLGREQTELLAGVDTILLGRATYDMFVGYWPNVPEGDEKAFADKLNATPKLVFSRKLDRAPWGKWDDAKIVRSSPTDEVAKLKKQSGKDLVVWGSLSIAQALMAADLIDEYRLVICPVVLGTGKPLFKDETLARRLKVLNALTMDRGAVQMKCVPEEAHSAVRG